MKVLFFYRDKIKVEQLVIALRMRWPDLTALLALEGGQGIRTIHSEEPDLVVLREDLPNMDIGSAIRETRAFSDVPILVASEIAGELDVVRALELGADEYTRMPCDMMEVLARVIALLRRTGLSRERANEGPVDCGDLMINPASYEAYFKSERLPLTPTEFKLLYLLAKNRNVTVSQRYIQRTIWTGSTEATQALKKYIQRLRRKLGDDARDPTWIRTVHGVGYRFAVPTTSTA